MNNKIKNFPWTLLVLLIVGLSSCSKYNSQGFTPGKGAPTITSIHTLSKSDTALISLYATTIDTSGNTNTSIIATIQNSHPFDSVTNAGYLGNYYVLHGSNLGSATSITFNGTIAYFSRALSTDNTIIVAVPGTTPYFGPKATDSLVVTTLHGMAYYKFAIIPPPPTPVTYSNYNFTAGAKITLTGVGFGAVTGVKLMDTTSAFPTDSIPLTVVSQNDSVITLQFPATTMSQGYLKFDYSAAGTPTSQTIGQALVDVDNAYQIFTNGSLQNGWHDGSWTKANPDISTTVLKTGPASFVVTYPAGAWQVEGFAASGGSGPIYSPDYKYLSFWIKGGTVSHTLNIVSDQAAGGWGQHSINPIVVPPTVWTYFKIPINTLGLTGWTAGTQLTSIGFFLKGSSGDVNENYYFDDVILIK